MSALGKFLKFPKKKILLAATAGLAGFTVTLNSDTNIPMVQAKTTAASPSLENMIIFRGMADQVTDSFDKVTLNEDSKTVDSKREDYLDWNEYFMAVSFLSAMRSKDPATQVGACIVNSDKKIVGTGYNGMPIGCSDDSLPWGKSGQSELDNKHMYVCHAEMNAILNKYSESVGGCTIYVSLFPCNECAKIIIQSGIKTVIYLSDKHKDKTSTIASKRMLNMAGVTYTQFVPKMKKIVINFDSVDPTDVRVVMEEKNNI